MTTTASPSSAIHQAILTSKRIRQRLLPSLPAIPMETRSVFHSQGPTLQNSQSIHPAMSLLLQHPIMKIQPMRIQTTSTNSASLFPMDRSQPQRLLPSQSPMILPIIQTQTPLVAFTSSTVTSPYKMPSSVK